MNVYIGEPEKKVGSCRECNIAVHFIISAKMTAKVYARKYFDSHNVNVKTSPVVSRVQ